jgi:oligosaccharide repeat unit polymerase
MSLEAALTLLVALVVGNYWLSRSVLYPPLFFSSMWLLALGLYKLDLTPVDDIHPGTFLVIGFGAFMFSLGGFLALYAPRNLIASRLILTRFPQRNNIVKPALTLFLLCGIPVLLKNLLTMAATGVGTTVMQRARTSGAVGGDIADVNPIGTYFILWSCYAAILFLLERRDKTFWLMALTAFVAGVLSTGRLPIFMLVCSLTCVQLLLMGRHTFWAAVRFARTPIIIFLGLFSLLFFTNKDTSVFEASGVGELLVIFFVGYIVGPTAALDVFLEHPNNYPAAPNHTFRFFSGILTHLHLGNYIAPPAETHIFVPFPTNVYTVYRTYVSDYGLFGAIGTMALIGFLHTLLYRKARTGSRLGIYLFAATFYQIMMVIFSDEYASFGAYIDMLMFAAIYILLRSIPMRFLPRLESGYGVDG